ncbi:MAG TPA: diacylglycerol kinase family protein [Gemmatimonadales bacterium]|nr:diacylglycerol kinase family protein [Gemmatimonadales bacterium]
MRTLVIFNPWAGRGRARKSRNLVLRGLRHAGIAFDLAETTGPGHALGMAREAARGDIRRIIVAGGDGTVHEVVNGLMQAGLDDEGATRASVGVIALGTGNDFAKLVNMNKIPPEVAAVRLAHATADRFDLGHCLGEYFDNIMGAGFDAEVVRQSNRIRRLWGMMVYLVAIYRTFVFFRPPRLEIVTEPHRESGEMMMVAIANGFCGGGGFYLTPHADPTDGELDLCLVRKVGLFTFLRAVPKVMKGTHGELEAAELWRARQATVRSLDGRPLVLQLDGELREPGLHEVTVTIEPRRLRVLVGR